MEATGTGRTSGDGLTEPAAPSMLARRLRAEHSGTRFFCGMGVCLECEEEVHGRIVRLCLESSRP